jgi:hypothetical protein
MLPSNFAAINSVLSHGFGDKAASHSQLAKPRITVIPRSFKNVRICGGRMCRTQQYRCSEIQTFEVTSRRGLASAY